MKSPPHSGPLIRDNIADLGLTVAEGAAALGVTRQQLCNFINGKSRVTPEMAQRLEKAFGGSANMWLRMLANFGLALLRGREAAIGVARLIPRAA